MKGLKIFLGLAIGVGAFALAKYLLTQRKLLTKVCVESTSLEWRELIIDAVKAKLQGGNVPTSIPLELNMRNASDVDVEVKNIDLDIYFDDIHIGSIQSQQESILSANSISTLELDVDLDLKGDLIDLGLNIFAGDNTLEIFGNMKLKASIYEEYNYPYQLKVQGSKILKRRSGDCK